MVTKVVEKFAQEFDLVAICTVVFLISAWLVRSRRQLLGVACALTSIALAAYLRALLEWLGALGADSFMELGDFDVKEGWFWLRSAAAGFSGVNIDLRTFMFVLGCSAVLAAIGGVVLSRWNRGARILPLALAAALAAPVTGAVRSFQDSRVQIEALQETFVAAAPSIRTAPDIDLLLYIGESTSTLNMSLYGYPLKTTPRLDEFSREPGFIRFRDVRSLHTHTFPSLIEALSMQWPTSGSVARAGLGSVLGSAGRELKVYSSQPQDGLSASLARYVFARDPRSKAAREATGAAGKDADVLALAVREPGVVVFHSYAGHGEYLDNIEQDRSVVVSHPNLAFQGLFGSKYSEFTQSKMRDRLDDYNRAITYIDRNVRAALEAVKSRAKPAVMLYFADHGESIYTGRAHDSAKFIDEMATVPFIVYFNPSYVQAYPATVARYRQAAERNSSRSLAQVMPTIADILQLGLAGTAAPTVAAPPRDELMLRRETSNGSSAIHSLPNSWSSLVEVPFHGGAPEPTYMALARTAGLSADRTLCYHRSDSYAKALRGASVAHCLEVDLVVDGGKLLIHHPPLPPTGLTLQHVFEIAEFRKNSLWIDGKNLDEPAACMVLASYLAANMSRVGGVLVEFPTTAAARLGPLRDCLLSLRASGAKTSLYLPTEAGLACARRPDDLEPCAEVKAAAAAAVESGLFSDVSFDYEIVDVIRKLPVVRRLKWNTWSIDIRRLRFVPAADFDFVIVDTSTDPNTY